MRKIGTGACVLAAALVFTAASAPARAQRAKVLSAYEQLPTQRLIKQLSLLGMTELLEQMEAEIPAADRSFAATALRGRIRMGLANALDDPEARNAKMDEAIDLLREAVKKAQADNSAGTGDKLLEYRVTFELAAALGRYRVENPHILRLRLLLGSDSDRKVVLKNTREAVDLVDYLLDKIDRTLMDLRVPANMEQYIMFGPKMEDLLLEIRYNAGWIHLHRAMALPAGAERAELCDNVKSDMREFINDPESGVMGWARYATAVADRLSGEHEAAEERLKKLAENPAENKELRQRAWFERVVNRIDEGADAKIDRALEDFEKGSVAMWGEGKQVIVDLRLVLLKSYRVERAAIKETDAEKRKALFVESQAVLLSFVKKYADRPDLIRPFLEMINTKFSGDVDLANASAVVCMARAYSKLGSDKPEDQAEGERLLVRVLNHEDLKNPKIAQAIEPGVLYELAFIRNERKLNVDASKLFVRLAKRYPEHELADKCAKFAVRSLYAVFEERRQGGKVIPTDLRLEFIRALETMLARFSDAESVKWNFDLGTQCARLAEQSEDLLVKLYWQSRAIAADEKVPTDLLEYMEAQNAALEMRTEIVLASDDLTELLAGDGSGLDRSLRGLAGTLLDLQTVALPRSVMVVAEGDDVTASPTEEPASRPEADAVAKKVAETADGLRQSVKTYSDAAALIEKLKKYSVDAMGESAKAAQRAKTADGEQKSLYLANAEGLREWSYRAEYQAAVIKYDQLAKTRAGDDPDQRKLIEREALKDLETLIARLRADGEAGSNGKTSARDFSPVLPMAHEFEIRKLIELGRTDEAIEKIGQFKQTFPAQAKQLIGILVRQIRSQIARLEKRLRAARRQVDAQEIREALNRYQQAYVNFARDLYTAVADQPIPLPELNEALRKLRASEAGGDFAGVLAVAEKVGQLAKDSRVNLAETKPKDAQKLQTVMAAAKAPGADKQAILPDLAAAANNVLLNLRDEVLERYGLIQMYADALLAQGKAEALSNQQAASKAAYQQALDLFKKCFGIDEAVRKGQADWLTKKYQPHIDNVKAKARSMDAVKQMVAGFRRELESAGFDPNESPDMKSVQYAETYLTGAKDQDEERRRLPRAVGLLTRGWENLLKKLQNETTVDHLNIIGMARAHRGLADYGEAMAQYRRYTDGISHVDFPKEYWQAELERSQCHLDGYKDKPEAMKNLVIQINSLKIKDKEMGGLAAEFEVIRNQAAGQSGG